MFTTRLAVSRVKGSVKIEIEGSKPIYIDCDDARELADLLSHFAYEIERVKPEDSELGDEEVEFFGQNEPIVFVKDTEE